MTTSYPIYSNFVPQQDYTSRDFSSISEDLQNLIQYFLPEWTSRDTSDFGITMIELFAAAADNLSFFIDRAANEAFLTTASQRSSILDIANLLNYVPANARAATTSVTFSNSTSSSITIPAGTQVSTTTVVNSNNEQINFQTLYTTVVPAAASSSSPGTVSTQVVEGTTYTDPVQISDGLANQSYQLLNAPVVDGTISVTVDSIPYTYIKNIVDAGANDPFFSTTYDDLGNSYIIFGDNISGRIPPINTQLTFTYTVGSGSSGNVAAGSITNITNLAQPGLTVSQPSAAYGGADQEATDSIRVNATKKISTLNRVVTLQDYADYVNSNLGADKANAVANSFTSVIVYAAQSGDPGVSSGSFTSNFTILQTNILNGLASVIPPNTTVTVLPPSYVNVDVSVTVTVLANRKATTVQTAVVAAISNLLSFTYTSFGETIYQTDIASAVAAVDGVASYTITLLCRDGSSGVQDITTQYFEIPQANNISITTVGGI